MTQLGEVATGTRRAVNWPALGFGGGSAFVGAPGEVESAALLQHDLTVCICF